MKSYTSFSHLVDLHGIISYHLVAHFFVILLTCYQAEAGGKLSWNLGDEVTSQAAGLKAGVLHQEEDGVWDLCELTFTQVWNGTA